MRDEQEGERDRPRNGSRGLDGVTLTLIGFIVDDLHALIYQWSVSQVPFSQSLVQGWVDGSPPMWFICDGPFLNLFSSFVATAWQIKGDSSE
jgi:hypothetical protein